MSAFSPHHLDDLALCFARAAVDSFLKESAVSNVVPFKDVAMCECGRSVVTTVAGPKLCCEFCRDEFVATECNKLVSLPEMPPGPSLTEILAKVLEKST